MLNKLLTSIILSCGLAMAAGWDIFNPKYAGNAQVRAGYDYNHTYENGEGFVQGRAVLLENVELSAKVYGYDLDNVSVKVDVFDYGAVAAQYNDFDESFDLAVQFYYDFEGSSIGAEYSYNTESKEVNLTYEIDAYSGNNIFYAGGNVSSSGDNTASGWYFGYVRTFSKFDVGICNYFFGYDSGAAVGTSVDFTYKF